MRVPRLTETVRMAEIAFVGVADSTPVLTGDGDRTTHHYRIRVERAWRWPGGSAHPPAILTLAESGMRICGGPLLPGARAVFVGRSVNDSTFVRADGCTQAGPVDTTAASAAALRDASGPNAPRRWLAERRQILRAVEHHLGRGTRPAS